MRKKHTQSTFRIARLTNLARSAVIVGACGALGYFLLQQSQAATYATSSEAESATIAGNAAAITEVNASAGSAVRFGLAAAAPTTPTNLITYTGGTSIALRWDGSAASGVASIKQYDIYRNNTKIASVTPGWHDSFPEKDGNGYIDSSITANTTYSYQVQAVDTVGNTSQMSTAVSVKQPASGATASVPTVTVDSSAAPSLANWMNNSVTPFVKIWYPKIVDKYATGSYTPAVNTFKFVADASATSDTWARNGNTMTYTLASKNRTTTTQLQDFSFISTSMTWQAIDNLHSVEQWLTNTLPIYPYNEMINAYGNSAINSLASYQGNAYTGVNFLHWIEDTYSPRLMRDLATGARNSTLSTAQFVTASNGKTLDQLWTEYTGRKVGTSAPITGPGGFCLSAWGIDSNYSSGLYTCGGYMSEGWKKMYLAGSNDTFQFIAHDKYCMNVANKATAVGSQVVYGYCGGAGSSPDSIWKLGANNSIVNNASGLCLQTKNAAATFQTPVVLATCDGSASQKWNVASDTGTAMAAPTGLKVYTGGNNIAMHWDVPANPYNRLFNIYRNGVKIGVSRQDYYSFNNTFGTAYTDTAVSNGSNYSYQVQAVDNNGNTSPLSATVAVTQPTSTVAAPSVTLDSSISTLFPQQLPWYNNVAIPYIKTWYPKIANLIAYPAYTPTSAITIKTMDQATYDAQHPGSSAFVEPNNGAPNTMFINPDYVTENADYESGTIVHEATHIIQTNFGGSTTSRWYLEGSAEYASAFIMRTYTNVANQPVSSNPLSYDPVTSNNFYATDYYRPAAALIDYIVRNYDSNFNRTLNLANYNDSFTNAMMQLSDGKNLDQAFGDMGGFGSRVGALKQASSARCADSDANTGMKNGTKMQIWDCNGAIVQKIGVHVNSDGTAVLTDHGKCLQVNNGATANTTPVVLNDCLSTASSYSQTANARQLWTINADGTITSKVAANKCLETYNAGTANGTAMQIYDCNGANWQKWTAP